ncbi:hypothetical protein OTK49_02115 [Vibrio coralliirubri]|uniref:hypothetical protein n=1 Tax=Vibrio coralliirubri TaxID=1516159 RepID=UPI002283AB9C|nr:hypothetical protein [Vibrio coralliirubri]MCY9861310.1 hypothetical protein [Vibrio coralliirubri]
MIKYQTAYLVCNNTGETFSILDAKAFVKYVVNEKSNWEADRYFFVENSLEDCHGKSLIHIVQDEIATKRDKSNARIKRWGRFGGYKRSTGSYFRHPKTTAELRFIAGLEADGYKNLIRGRRKLIPTVYDDIWSPCNNNWKSFRHKQYK